jgi:hypothetical protein
LIAVSQLHSTSAGDGSTSLFQLMTGINLMPLPQRGETQKPVAAAP